MIHTITCLMSFEVIWLIFAKVIGGVCANEDLIKLWTAWEIISLRTSIVHYFGQQVHHFLKNSELCKNTDPNFYIGWGWCLFLEERWASYNYRPNKLLNSHNFLQEVGRNFRKWNSLMSLLLMKRNLVNLPAQWNRIEPADVLGSSKSPLNVS
jgi:hypothetical protein